MSEGKPPILPQTPVSTAPPSNFPRRAAMFSLAAPFLGIGANLITTLIARGNRGALLLGAVASIGLIVAGLTFGILALVSNRKHNLDGVTPRAVGGVCISGFLILLMAAGLPGLVRAIEKAKQHPGSKPIERQAPANL